MSEKLKISWLKDHLGDKIIPKTTVNEVLMDYDSSVTLQDKLNKLEEKGIKIYSANGGTSYYDEKLGLVHEQTVPDFDIKSPHLLKFSVGSGFIYNEGVIKINNEHIIPIKINGLIEFYKKFLGITLPALQTADIGEVWYLYSNKEYWYIPIDNSFMLNISLLTHFLVTFQTEFSEGIENYQDLFSIKRAIEKTLENNENLQNISESLQVLEALTNTIFMLFDENFQQEWMKFLERGEDFPSIQRIIARENRKTSLSKETFKILESPDDSGKVSEFFMPYHFYGVEGITKECVFQQGIVDDAGSIIWAIVGAESNLAYVLGISPEAANLVSMESGVYIVSGAQKAFLSVAKNEEINNEFLPQGIGYEVKGDPIIIGPEMINDFPIINFVPELFGDDNGFCLKRITDTPLTNLEGKNVSVEMREISYGGVDKISSVSEGLSFNGILYDLTKYIMGEGFPIPFEKIYGLGEDEIILFLFATQGSQNVPRGTYVLFTEDSETCILPYQITGLIDPEIHTIDEKFLPDTIVRKEDIQKYIDEAFGGSW